ncbi:MAG: class I SAM-dependent RNA methyltransferase [Holophagaceae bacterium]|nr:class I SAM-dependent RNA methyltransferase [Holophagaceae bacterium]
MARAEDGRLLLLSSPLALFPGEEVEAEVRWKARHGEGQVLRWIKRDPRRVPAGCPVAATCGGCDLWEAGGAAAELKRSMIADLLHRQLPGIQDWRYLPAPAEARRHRIQLHWDGTALGYHGRGSHQIVPVKACPIAADSLSNAIPRLREAIQEKILPQRPQRWELATGTPEGRVVAIDEQGHVWLLDPDGWHRDVSEMSEIFEDFSLRHRAGGFFQVSPPWAVQAFRSVLEGWHLGGGTLFDLYGGVGLFSALLGKRFQRRVLVEYDIAAVEWAKRNLERLELPSDCIASDIGKWLPEYLGDAEDVILLDPPRSGLEPEVSAKLLTARAETMVLVGCDGAAFCRDLHRLGPAWKLRDLAVLDLFPLTHHVECMGLLKRA